jgi:hypothetical protein
MHRIGIEVSNAKKRDIVNTIIELHDSKIGEIAKQGDTVVVHFLKAYLHKSEGRPGFDCGTGWTQSAKLIFASASASGNFPDLPCDVMGGDLVVGGQLHANMIPVPLDVAAPVKLRLVFDSIHTVLIIGQGVRLEFLGEPKYVEEVRQHH